MKRIFAILCLVALAACAREEAGGIYSGSDERSKPGENYMTILSTDLIPDFLIVLESALTYDGYGYYTSNNSTDYITGGKSIRTVGNAWTVSSKKKVKGMEIKCTAADTWELKWHGPYSFYTSYYREDDDEYAYETACNITATLLKETNSGHYDWKVVFSGDRTEREGYACHIDTAPDMTFSNTNTLSYVWDTCTGSATMLVTKNGEKVDFARMDYLGTSTRYFRGL